MPRKVFVAGEILTAADVNTNLMDQAVMVFADAAARTTAIPSPSEGMVTYLSDSDTVEAWNGSAFVNVASVGTSAYRFVSTEYFTSSGTFSKATYPWLRAIRVKCQGGGASGSIRSFNGQSGTGGAGGGYAESFITDIAGLDASVTITIGAGGAAVTRSTSGETLGNAGANSSFGALVVGNGAPAPGSTLTSTTGGSGTGNLVFPGGGAAPGAGSDAPAGNGGGSHLGHGGTGGFLTTTNQNGAVGSLYGGGGGGARVAAQASSVTSGAGANGIVIVELYG